MSRVKHDWAYSTNVFNTSAVKEQIKLYYGTNESLQASSEEDRDNNIDYYIDGIPIQLRTQRVTNKKSKNYYPTLRYSRNHSYYNSRKRSEFLKILDNKKRGTPYPKHLIWVLYDKSNSRIESLIITDIEKLTNDYNNNEYALWEDSRTSTKALDNSDSVNILWVKKNDDYSSEFLILDTSVLLPGTILYTYNN